MRRNDLSGKKKRLRAQPSRLLPTAADAPRFDSAGPNLSSKRRVNSKGGAQRRRGESSRRETARRRFSASGTAQRRAPIEAGRFSAGGQTAGAIGGSIVFLRRASPQPLEAWARPARFPAAPASILASWRAALGLLRPKCHLPQIRQTPGERRTAVEKQRMQRIAREGRAVDAERGGQGAA